MSATVGATNGQRLGTAIIWLALAAGAVAMLFPIYWMFATAIRPRAEVFEALVALIPSTPTWENFAGLLSRYPVWHWAGNSLFIAFFGVVITVFVNLLCGYTFAKFRFFGRDILFFAILGALMIPI